MKPIFKLKANGRNITHLLNKHLISLTLTDEAGSNSDKLSISLDDRENTINLPKTGAILAVAFGYAETGLIQKGSFYVDEIKLSWSPRKIEITARSANLRKELRVKHDKSFHKKTLKEIVQYIANNHGLTPKITGVLGAEVIEHIDQTNESDISFLDRLADERDAVVKVHENMLIFAREATAKSISNKKLPTINLDIKETTSGSCTLSDRERYNSVTAEYHNPKTAQKEQVVAKITENNNYTINEKTFASKTEAEKAAKNKLTDIGFGKAETAEQAKSYKDYDSVTAFYEDSATQTRNPVTVYKELQNYIIRKIYDSIKSANKAAKSKLTKLSRLTEKMTINMVGNPQISAESNLNITGLKQGLNGHWTVKKATHKISNSGYSLALELQPTKPR